jgi:thiol-disulfide isomerase/thioredoxin
MAVRAQSVAPAGLAISDALLVSDNGQPVRVSDYRGKVVFINFWGSWCTPCLLEMASIRRLQEALRDRSRDIAFLFVSAKPDQQRNDSVWLRQHGIADISYRSESGSLIRNVPSTFILDPSGRVAVYRSTPVDWQIHTDAIRNFLPDRIRRAAAN